MFAFIFRIIVTLTKIKKSNLVFKYGVYKVSVKLISEECFGMYSILKISVWKMSNFEEFFRPRTEDRTIVGSNLSIFLHRTIILLKTEDLSKKY